MSFHSYSLKEKICSTLSYLTFGIAGFILLLLGQAHEHYMKFNIFQSILIGLLYLLLTEGLSILIRIIIFIIQLAPGDNVLLQPVLQFTGLSTEILFFAVIGILAYCIFYVWRGQYPWLRYISEQIYKIL